MKAALAIAGLNLSEWAEKQGVSTGHIYLVLDGDRPSQRLLDEMDAFIVEQLPHVRIA